MENELIKRKVLSVYQLLLGFLIADGRFEPEEEDLVIGYIMQNYEVMDKDDISLDEQIRNLAADEDNFLNNAMALKMTSPKQELVDILLFISTLMFADKEFSDKEYGLFIKLMQAWDISKEDLKS